MLLTSLELTEMTLIKPLCILTLLILIFSAVQSCPMYKSTGSFPMGPKSELQIATSEKVIISMEQQYFRWEDLEGYQSVMLTLTCAEPTKQLQGELNRGLL